MYYLQDKNSNYAFICPKKIAIAIKRNKVKRQLKEGFLKHTNKLDTNYSVIFIANKNILDCPFKKISDMILLSLIKKKLINEETKHFFN